MKMENLLKNVIFTLASGLMALNAQAAVDCQASVKTITKGGHSQVIGDIQLTESRDAYLQAKTYEGEIANYHFFIGIPSDLRKSSPQAFIVKRSAINETSLATHLPWPTVERKYTTTEIRDVDVKTGSVTMIELACSYKLEDHQSSGASLTQESCPSVPPVCGNGPVNCPCMP